jgi:hypothetical protein
MDIVFGKIESGPQVEPSSFRVILIGRNKTSDTLNGKMAVN